MSEAWGRKRLHVRGVVSPELQNHVTRVLYLLHPRVYVRGSPIVIGAIVAHDAEAQLARAGRDEE